MKTNQYFAELDKMITASADATPSSYEMECDQ